MRQLNYLNAARRKTPAFFILAGLFLSVGFGASASLSVESAHADDGRVSAGSVPVCNGVRATIFVAGGEIIGGPMSGAKYYGFLRGTAGDDVIAGTDANDIIGGKGGNDTICGFAGHDVVYGDDGDDWMDGGNGNDVLLGGAGNDTLASGVGSNALDGGQGTNVCHVGADQNITIRCQAIN